MSAYDLLTIGDVTSDVFITPSESEAMCILDDKEELICFTYGDKIPVKQIEYSLGGNAANNAVGAKRLGVNVGLIATLGGDSTGDMIVNTLDKEGVDLTYTIRQPAANSNYSTIVNYSGERTIFTYKAPRSYEFPVHMPAAPWIYLTSMGESFRPFYNHFVEWLRKNQNVKLAFNPGSRQLRAGADSYKDVLELTHAIYVNKSEAKMIAGVGSEEDIKNILVALNKTGPKICIVTDGSNGSFVYDGSRFLKAGVLPVDAFERTGAGDSFGAGCLSALIKGKPFEEALLWGTVNSASVIGYVGGQKGLLHENEIGTWLARAESCGVKVEEF
jgi:ribokinase